MTLTQVAQTGPTTVHLEVGVVYASDQDPGEDASVVATMTDATGGTVGPIDLVRVERLGAVYAADVDLTAPGKWSIEVSSTGPTAATSAVTEVVAQAPSAADAEVTTSAPDQAPEEQIVTANGAEGVADSSPATTAAGTDPQEKGNGAVFIVLAVVAFVLAVGAGAVVVIRRGDNGAVEGHTPDEMPDDATPT